MSADEPTLGGTTQPCLTACCAIDPDNPTQYVIPYSGAGFRPGGMQVDLTIRGANQPVGSGNPFAPGGHTGSFSGKQVYRGELGRKVFIQVDRSIPHLEVAVTCPVLPDQ